MAVHQSDDLRLAEFDTLFTTAVRAVRHTDPALLRLELDPTGEVAAHVADLMMWAVSRSAYLTFSLTATSSELWLDITVPPARVDVLHALAARATAAITA
ncbi:hypothetical protein [Amycolatopsis suaedae]|uniref:Uncharacterized protein n=1 Tax=Amycolatopsis suaedae TaxID=2510978 RepID=A0A4Q7JD77_9PSEU|nr:hypothetical protein [Amycolatopsis suaedae]RZQ65016.1 hypothetical protein EWH70_03680 [Amycolatopsis suaedae]